MTSKSGPGILTRAKCAGVPVALALTQILVGCGEQDLYKPPRSPIQVVSRVPLPSIAEDVSVLGDYAYVAGGESGLHIVNISDPRAPVLVSTIDTRKYAEAIKVASTPSAGTVLDVAYIVEGTEGITTYNVTNPDSAYSFQQGTTAVDGNGLYIEFPENPADPYFVYLAENWHGIRIFESNPLIPGLLTYNGVFAPTRGYAKSIAVADGFAYVADDELGLAVLDVRVKVLGSVKVVNAIDTPGNARGIDVKNGYAYIADGLNGLVVARVHEADTPVLVGQIPLPGLCRAIAVRDSRAYIAAQDGGVHVVGVSDPAQPVLLGTVVTTYATGIALAASGVVVVSDRVEGLVILGGQGPFLDTIPPAAIRDLAAAPVDSSSIRVTWHATGNDHFGGTAAVYDLRYAAEPITPESWDQAVAVEGEPAPSRSGTEESHRVTGLNPVTEYFFAIQASDAAGNRSALSNVASAVTFQGNVSPNLANGSVLPEGGPPIEPFTFEVTYSDGDGDPPVQKDVVINGERHSMSLLSGEYREGAVFQYTTNLSRGSYLFIFEFSDGHGHAVTTRPTPGPWVGDLLLMGSPADEMGRGEDEVQHTVVFTTRVQFTDHEVTQAEYQEIMGSNPSRHVGPLRPVENVTWIDAVRYCNQRSTREGLQFAYAIDGDAVTWNLDADGYRLPTEAEWEAACRAGSTLAFSNGPITEPLCGLDPNLNALGWYCGNAGGDGPHEVKTKAANAAGLYDMHGNVWEWCWDWYGELTTGIAGDPVGPATGMQRVIRGGSWYYFAQDCRSASRGAYWPNSGDDVVGFRVVRSAP